MTLDTSEAATADLKAFEEHDVPPSKRARSADLANPSSQHHVSACEIPTVDLSLPRDEVIQSIRAAADEDGPGFFYLQNHGIAESLFDTCIAAAHKFYARDQKYKNSFSRTFVRADGTEMVGGAGYRAPMTEGAYEKDASDVRPDAEKVTGLRNMRESLTLRYPRFTDVMESVLPADGCGYCPGSDEGVDDFATRYSSWRARWSQEHAVGDISDVDKALFAEAARFWLCSDTPIPEELESMIPLLTAAMRAAAKEVSDCFRMILEKEGYLPPLQKDASNLPSQLGMATFNVAHYMPSVSHPQDAGQVFGISDHTDWELFTLLYPTYFMPERHESSALANRSTAASPPALDEKDLYTGLEVWHKDKWVQVPSKPGCLIVNQGEILSRLSNGRFAAPVHRVANPPRERYSLVSFWAPNFDVAVPDPVKGKMPVGEHYLLRNQFCTTAPRK